MPIPATHDFGTVRLFVVGDIVEAYFPKDDTTSRGVVKGMRGFFDGRRRAWRVDPRNARLSTEAIVSGFRKALVEAAPEKWIQALPRLSTIAATTRDFTLKMGEGGMRVQLPPGHRHEYTLAQEVSGAFKDGPVWLLPASICANKTVKGIILDVVQDDRVALGEAIDYLDGFVFTGELDIVPDEVGQIGLAPGAVVFADPSFIRLADQNIGPEPVHEYPLRVAGLERSGDGWSARLGVLTGEAGWRSLGTRYARETGERTKPLDGTHLSGRWVRRRG